MLKKIAYIKIILVASVLGSLNSCNKYLDVVPDNVATIESAFTMRVGAERYLFTCYYWMPGHADLGWNPGFIAGGEMWGLFPNYVNTQALNIVAGNQNTVSPYIDSWSSAFAGIRDCNVFLEHIHMVQDITETERKQWIAEVKFLKAYYHFWLIRMYGPIPLMRESTPINAGVEEVKKPRDPFDECIDYVVELIDEAMPDLPLTIEDEVSDLGRVTKPVAASMKAYMLVTAASPLFNGNNLFAGLVDADNNPLFNLTEDKGKWTRAAEASKEAIDICHEAGISLYQFSLGAGQNVPLSDTTKIQMSIRGSVTERWNTETIWADPNSLMNQEDLYTVWDPFVNPNALQGKYGPTLQIAELFYSENGVPINEDKTFDYANRYALKTSTSADMYNIKPFYTTAKLHFNRENRFYATLGFDGGAWYGQGRNNDNNLWYLEGKAGQPAGFQRREAHSPTGYWAKKLIAYRTSMGQSSLTQDWYPWPIIRLADLYLLYAEASNEAEGPNAEVYKYINLVRERAGLKTVEEAWSDFSKQPTKYQSQDGLREIIHQERSIELALEGQRFWDLRRWMKAHEELVSPPKGWYILGDSPETYYRQQTVYNTRSYRLREYLWPIRDAVLLENRNLVQNPGW